MSDVGHAVAFAARLYRQRTAVACSGYVRRDPVALLSLRPGRADPYPVYERIRASGTLVPTRLGNWLSTSHRVCDVVLRNRRFGVRLDGGEAAEPGDFDLSFLEMNPPDHTRLRRLAQPAFSPKAVTGYRDRIERTVGDLLDRAATKGEFDLVSTLAAPLPIAVITELLGIPDADADAFAQDGAVIGSALDGIKSLRHASQLQASSVKLQRLFGNLFELRRREPAGDIISRLVAAEGDQVNPAEMLSMCVLLLVAGFRLRST
jgi:cytochrome P450